MLGGTFKQSDIERNSALSYKGASNKRIQMSGIISPVSKVTQDKTTTESKDNIFGRRHHSTIEDIKLNTVFRGNEVLASRIKAHESNTLEIEQPGTRSPPIAVNRAFNRSVLPNSTRNTVFAKET